MRLDYYDTEYSNRGGSPYCVTAGAVVYRVNNNSPEFLLLLRFVDGIETWHLPKGTLRVGETLEACALREVLEETGARVQLKTYIGASNAAFTHQGNVYDKTAHFYVAEYIAIEGKMDAEHDDKVWCTVDEAITRLQIEPKREEVFLQRCIDYLVNVGM